MTPEAFNLIGSGLLFTVSFLMLLSGIGKQNTYGESELGFSLAMIGGIGAVLGLFLVLQTWGPFGQAMWGGR